jgi:NOL1/NOP2/sun family putative RNA methylase
VTPSEGASAPHDADDPTDPLSRYRPVVDDYEAFRAACDRPLGMTVRTNPIKATPDRVARALDGAGLAHERADWHSGIFRLETDSPGNTWPYVHGWVHGQEEVSALPARVLDPSPGDRVFDPCAAPGSKTTQLAGLMDDRGRVVANDASLGRLSALRSNAERLGVTSVAVTNADARNYSLAPFDGQRFDAALVDVPCSCEGTVRKNPDALDGWSVGGLRSLADIQRAILERAVEVVDPGGRVVYSTCTFAPEENEAVVDAVLDGHDCRVVETDLPVEHADGLRSWRDRGFDPSLSRAVRVYPHHADTGGFFLATLEVGDR